MGISTQRPRNAALAVATAVAGLTALAAPVYAAGTNQHGSQAGWTGTAQTSFTAAAGKLTLPSTMTCPSSGGVGLTIGVSWSGPNPNLAGLANAALNVSAFCNNGLLSLQANVSEVDATGSETRSIAVALGDALAVNLSLTSGGFRVVGKNLRTGQSATANGYTSIGWTSANYDLTSSPPPIPSFTSFKFSGLTIGGVAAASRLTLTGFDMYNGTHLLVRASPLTSTSFNDTFVAAS